MFQTTIVSYLFCCSSLLLSVSEKSDVESQGSAGKGREEYKLEIIGGIEMRSERREDTREGSLRFHGVCLP